LKSLLIPIILMCGLAYGQAAKLSIPKQSPSYKRTSRDVGPHPGSKVAGQGGEQSFSRIYSRPATMRMLVRANCSTTINPSELINRARQLSTTSGQVIQIDWEPIQGDKVAFWAVASATRKVTKIELTEVEGKYKAGNRKTSPHEHWEVARLTIGNEVKVTKCADITKLSNSDIKKAVINFLNRFTVDFFRRPSHQFSSNTTR